MAALKNVIYLSNEDYELLITNGTVTIGSTTLTYDEDNLYITPEKLASITEAGLMSAEDKVKLNNILNLPAASGGTDDSLVTTGDKYRWNNMSGDNQTIKVGSTEFGVNDVINFVAGSDNITITSATTGMGAPKITFDAKDTTYTLSQPTGESNKVRLDRVTPSSSTGTAITINNVAHATAADSAESASTAGHADSADSATNASNLGNHAPSYYAVDTNVVHKTGDETINGEKTFSTRPQLVGSRLPTEYQEVTNLIFDGSTGYVDSQLVITVADNLSIEMDASWRGNNTNFATFFGYMKSSQTVTPRCAFSIYSNRYMIGIDSTTSSSTAPASGRHIYKFYTNNGSQILTVDDIVQVQTNYYSSALTSNQLTSYIGARNTANTAGNFADIDVYSVKIIHNNVGYDLVPCYRKSDNKTGFYDTIHNTFLPSTGGVTKGDNVSSSTFAVMNDFAAVAFTGEYSSLKNTPTSRAAAQNGTDLSLVTTGEKYTWNNKSDFSGNYNDLTNKPTIPTDYVKLTTNQTIEGVKTFTSRPALQVERLPNTYQEVTYLHADGNQYINTGIPGHMGWTYKLIYQQDNAVSYRCWGVFNQSSYNGGLNMSLTYTFPDWMLRWETTSGQTRNVLLAPIDTNQHTLVVDNGETYFDNVYKGVSAAHDSSVVSNYNVYLFTINPGGTTPTTNLVGKIFYYEVYDNNGVLQQQFIPCIRKSDNKPGFYDLVSNTFKTNASGSSTDFTVGANVVNSEFLVAADLAAVATSGDYTDLINKPTIPNELSDLIADSTHRVVTDAQISTWNAKQAALTFDNTPTEDSTNPVKSGGVYDAIEEVREVAEGKTATYVVSDVTNPAFNSQDATITITSSITDVNKGTITLDKFSIGDNIYVTQTDVPDRWVSTINKQNDSVTSIVLSKLETAKVPVTDVKVGGSSVVSNGIASITLPPVNNAALTINKGGTDDTASKTFTANAASDVTINLGLATVATSGNYNDLSNKPTIPTNSDYVDLTTNQEINGRKDFIVNPRVKIDHIFHNLPEAYQELDYLESTGTQYINTGIYLTQDHSVEVDYQLTSTSQSRRGIFGQVETGLVNRYGVLLTASGNKTEYGYGSTNVYYQGSTLDLNRHKVKQEQNKLYVDGTLAYTFATATFTSTVNAPLGNFNYSNYTPALAKYYESKWWNNTTLIRDFIPCYRKADNKPGFYDIVNDEFYINAGTDEFTIGNALIPYTSYENLITADNFATVAFSGDYADLNNTPIIPTVNNATLTVTQNGTTKGTFTANSNTNTTIALTDTTYESKAAAQNGTDVSLVTTGEKYIWNHKQDALTIDTAVSLSSSNPVQNKAIGNYIAARGEHLLTNGFANLKNNYNFTTFDYDGSDTYYANGCFKKIGWGAYATYTNDEFIPVDVNMTYRFDFYTKTNHSGAQVNGYIRAYDIDGNEIGSYQVAPRANTLTTLAQDLKNGDTKIYLTDMSNWQSTNLGTNNASVLIWGYKNSYGYTYPPDTYTRYRYTSLWSQASQMDYANNCITLTSAWNKGPFAAGTPISQGQDGSGALYCNIDDVAITCTLKTDSDSSTQAMNGWEHHWYHINGVQNKNTFATSQFPFGTAFVKVGLMNRVTQTSSEYFKLSTMSFTTSAASVDQFKIPSSTGSYNYDYPILFKNHKNTNTEVANTSFATTLTYNPHSKALKINGTTISTTDNKTTQTATSTNNSYPVLFKNAASNTTETAGVNFDSDGTTNFYYNPSTNTLQATNITATTLNGKTIGNDPKFTDTDTNQTIKTKNSSSTDVTFSSDATVELVAGSNITITPDNTNNTITITSTAASEDTNQTIKVGNVTFGNNDVVELVGGGDTTVVGDATNKTITISSTASVTPGNGTLTLNRNNELGNSKIEVGTFTANQSTNISLDISDLYYCTYSATGEGTTVADVDAALALNKIPVCWFSNRLYVYHGINGNYRYFSCVTDRAAYIIRLMANSSDENYNKWSNNYDNFEFQYFKRSSTAGWGNGTLANISDSFYPSEKLVYESLQGVPAVYVVSKATNSAFNSSNDAITISSAITDIEGNSIALADFKLGNTIYVTETDVPDRWVGKITKSGSTVTSVILFKLETAKVPVTDIKIGVSGSEASCVDNSIAKLVTNSAYDASTNPLATMADITTVPTNLVTTNTAQTISATKTFTAAQKFQLGDPNGCAIFGADVGVGISTLTNNTRKLGRLTAPCAENITKTVGFVSIDNNVGYNNVEFGSRHGDSTSYGPDVIAFSVANEHNTTTRNNIAQFLKDKVQLFNHSSGSTSLNVAPNTDLVGMWELYNNNTFKNNGYTYTLPNTTGTIALTSDIPSQANDVTTADTLTANKLLLGNGNKTVKITTKELLDSGSSNSWAITDRITDTYVPTVKSIDNNKGVCIHLPSNKTSGTTADYNIRAYDTPSEAWDRAKIIDSNSNPVYAHDYYFERGGYYYYPENFSSTTTWYWSCPVYYNGNIITKRVLSLTRSNGDWTFTSYDYSPTFTDNDSKVDQYQSGTSKALSGTKYSILTRYAQDNKNGTYDNNYARYSTDVTIDTADGTLDALIIKENGSRLTPKVSSTTDNAAVRFDGTSGTIQNSAVIITDNKQVKAHGYVIQSTSGSTTTDKAEMLYDATEECIKFVFA